MLAIIRRMSDLARDIWLDYLNTAEIYRSLSSNFEDNFIYSIYKLKRYTYRQHFGENFV